MKVHIPKILEPKFKEIMQRNPGINPGAALVILYNEQQYKPKIKWKQI